MRATNSPCLSFNDHFCWSYNNQPFTFRQSINEAWSVTYGRSSRPLNSWREENRIAAQEVLNAAQGQKIWLCFSGGIDSEILLRSFIDAKIPFAVASVRLSQNANAHDLEWAERAVKALNIKTWKIFDLDVNRFFHSGQALDYAVSTQCTSPELLSTMWLMDQVDGYPVLGSGECLLVRQYQPGYVPGVSSYDSSCPWYLIEKETVSSWYKYGIWRKRSCAPGFFQFTPQQIQAFMVDPIVQRLVANQIVGKRDSASVKHDIYANYYPELERRTKYTGYEQLSDLRIDFQAFLERRFPGTHQYHYTPVKDFLIGKEPSHGIDTSTLAI